MPIAAVLALSLGGKSSCGGSAAGCALSYMFEISWRPRLRITETLGRSAHHAV
jgi:hypothetical protein